MAFYKKAERLYRSIVKYTHPPRVFFHDYRNNEKYAASENKILVVRHGYCKPWRYNIILDWIENYLPETRPYFELHQLPCRNLNWSKYILHIPWLQDPVQEWSIWAYRQACKISARCDELNIPIINRVENLVNASKSHGARIIGSTGIRTPKIMEITDIKMFKEDLYGMQLPLIIRDDWGHQGQMLLVENLAGLENICLGSIKRPIAIEYINTQSRDGLYRKYRYTIAGERGIPQSMHVRDIWLVRGNQTVKSDALFEEEKDFLNQPDPNHDQLLAASKALKLDFVAFDYSYTPEGELVVWEANPYPYLHFPNKRHYRKSATEKTLAAITSMYLLKAGLPESKTLKKFLQN